MNVKRLLPYLILDALFEGGRLFVGATSAAYLLAQGATLAEIALLKSLQAAVLLFAEVPTGLFADTYGRKTSLVLSVAIAACGFSLYFLAHSFVFYLFAEGLVALSLCFWSGAFEAYVIDNANLAEEPGAMDRFFHLSQAINSATILGFGYLGGVLGQTNLGLPYLGAALAMLLTLMALAPLPGGPAHETQNRVPLKKRAIAAFKLGIFSPRLAPFFWANIAIQFAIQPMLHFWQPLFQSLSASVTSETLGRIFCAYCATSLAFGTLAARFSHRSFFRSRGFSLLLFAAFGTTYLLVGLSQSVLFAIVCFCLAQGTLSVARTSLGVRLNEALQGLPRATMLSSLSLVSRLGMMGALGFISMTAKVAGQAQGSRHSFVIFGAFALIVTAIAALALGRQRRPRATAETTPSLATETAS